MYIKYAEPIYCHILIFALLQQLVVKGLGFSDYHCAVSNTVTKAALQHCVGVNVGSGLMTKL